MKHLSIRPTLVHEPIRHFIKLDDVILTPLWSVPLKSVVVTIACRGGSELLLLVLGPLHALPPDRSH